MQLVTAVIQPHRLYHVTQALEKAGVHGVTIVEAHGAGRQQGHTEIYRGAEYHVDLIPKIRLEGVLRPGLPPGRRRHLHRRPHRADR